MKMKMRIQGWKTILVLALLLACAGGKEILSPPMVAVPTYTVTTAANQDNKNKTKSNVVEIPRFKANDLEIRPSPVIERPPLAPMLPKSPKKADDEAADGYPGVSIVQNYAVTDLILPATATSTTTEDPIMFLNRIRQLPSESAISSLLSVKSLGSNHRNLGDGGEENEERTTESPIEILNRQRLDIERRRMRLKIRNRKTQRRRTTTTSTTTTFSTSTTTTSSTTSSSSSTTQRTTSEAESRNTPTETDSPSTLETFEFKVAASTTSAPTSSPVTSETPSTSSSSQGNTKMTLVKTSTLLNDNYQEIQHSTENIPVSTLEEATSSIPADFTSTPKETTSSIGASSNIVSDKENDLEMFSIPKTSLDSTTEQNLISTSLSKIELDNTRPLIFQESQNKNQSQESENQENERESRNHEEDFKTAILASVLGTFGLFLSVAFITFCLCRHHFKRKKNIYTTMEAEPQKRYFTSPGPPVILKHEVSSRPKRYSDSINVQRITEL